MFGQNLKCNDEEKKSLKEIFSKLTEIKITTINEKSKKIQVTKVTVKSITDIIDTLGWSDGEKELYYMFMENNLEEIFPDFIDDYDFYIGGQTKEILDSLQNEPATRERLIKTALSLVGKVGYFWGGRSSPGFNSEWGKMKLVTAPGNKNTGTYQPYGLDCSGFTSWVYSTAGFGNAISGGSSLQWKQSYAIDESELRPGDLVFKQNPTDSGVNHVGLYYKTENGKKLFIHCSSSKGVVVNSYNVKYVEL